MSRTWVAIIAAAVLSFSAVFTLNAWLGFSALCFLIVSWIWAIKETETTQYGEDDEPWQD